jgi:ankyrin repeat protein
MSPLSRPDLCPDRNPNHHPHRCWASKGHGEIIEELKALGADPTIKNKQGKHAIHEAVICNQEDSLRALLSWDLVQLDTPVLLSSPIESQ